MIDSTEQRLPVARVRAEVVMVQRNRSNLVFFFGSAVEFCTRVSAKGSAVPCASRQVSGTPKLADSDF